MIPLKLITPNARTLGITTLDPASLFTQFEGTPTILMVGYGNLGDFFVLPQTRANNSYQLTENITWQKGGNSLKVGVDLAQFELYQNKNTFIRGFFVFGGESGNAVADALLSTPAVTQRVVFSTPQVVGLPVPQYRRLLCAGWLEGLTQPDDQCRPALRGRYPIVWKGGETAAFNPVADSIQVPSDVKS